MGEESKIGGRRGEGYHTIREIIFQGLAAEHLEKPLGGADSCSRLLFLGQPTDGLFVEEATKDRDLRLVLGSIDTACLGGDRTGLR
jgi:hypothetical protein